MANEKIASKLYANDSKSGASGSGTGKKLYGDSRGSEIGTGQYDSAMKEGLDRLADKFGLTPKQVYQVREEVSQVFEELNLSTDEGSKLFDLYVHHMIKPADEELHSQWAEASNKLIRELGPDAKKKLQDAQSYVDQKPAFKSMMEKTGLGSHPDFIQALIEAIPHLRDAGKIRKKSTVLGGRSK